ncbi:hypothetical protein TrVFT333_002672 [Trichoderma virens FT-333]|nr:hypothetical protein TrVFT333_002672 [Trichoderma virens FT-333]
MDDQVPKELASSLNEQQMQELLRLHETGHLGRLLDLAGKRPTFISKILETREDVDVDPVLEYMSDLHIRKVLFWRLTSTIRRHKLPFELNMTVFALFMVAPMDMLRFRLDKLERDIEENNWTGVHEFIDKCSIAVAGIQEFVNRKSRQVKGCGKDTILHSAKLCKERDRSERIIADIEDPVVVPIFPFENLANTLSTLETFWGTEIATRLYALIQDQNILESPQNLLSLDRNTGWSFLKGEIAFKPLHDTATGSIELQLHWLKKAD